MASSEYEALEARLLAAGVPNSASKNKGPASLHFRGALSVLVNSTYSALPYEEILIGGLQQLRGPELEMVVRALSERGSSAPVCT